MAKKRSDAELFLEIVFRSDAETCRVMAQTLKAKIRALVPKKVRVPRKPKPLEVKAQ